MRNYGQWDATVVAVRAYVDESVRVASPGVYVLAAVVVPSSRALDIRAQLRSHVLPGGSRFHWHDEGQDRRAKFLQVFCGFSLPAVVAVAAPMDPKRQERGRRKCLEQLLWALEASGVRDVLLESRQERRDQSDRAAISAAQRAQKVPHGLRYAFGAPASEPLLWLPDVVAGVVSADRAGLPGPGLGALGSALTVLDSGPAV